MTTKLLTDVNAQILIDITEVAANVDVSEIANHIDTEAIAGHIDLSALATHVNVEPLACDPEDVAEQIAISDVASYFEPSDIAGYVDMEALSEEIDTDTIAEGAIEELRNDVASIAATHDMMTDQVNDLMAEIAELRSRTIGARYWRAVAWIRSKVRRAKR